MQLRYALPLVVLSAAALAACDSADQTSLYDPIADGTFSTKVDPVVTGITPASGQALAGVTTLTISGQNFVPSAPKDSALINGVKAPILKDSTYVYVNGVRVPVLSVTPTQITFKAPNVVSSGAQIKVGVLGASKFSSTQTYALLAAVERVGALKNNEQPTAMTTDRSGSTYTSLFIGGVASGIRKTNAQGADTLYAPSVSVYAGLAYSDPARTLYAGRNNRALYQINRGVGEAIFYDFANANDRNIRLRALDVDDAGNIWAGGSNTVAFYRVSPDKGTVITVPYAGTVLAIEARSDAVYVSGLEGTSNKILRFPVSGTTVGTPTTVVDVTAGLPGVQVTALAFAANGDLFMGTTRTTDPILQLRSGQTTLETLYPGLLTLDASATTSGMTGLSWGPGSLLHAASAEIVADSKSLQALGDVIRINTLRQGEH